MVEAEEEQDGNNGSPCLLLSPEVLEAMETLELMRVCVELAMPFLIFQ
jgi:hypothetical protein